MEPELCKQQEKQELQFCDFGAKGEVRLDGRVQGGQSH